MRIAWIVPLLATAALASTAAPAGAVPCANTLTDADGNSFTTGNTFSFSSTPAHSAYGGTGFGPNASAYQAPDPNGCTLEDAGREVAYPPDGFSGTPVEGTVKVY